MISPYFHLKIKRYIKPKKFTQIKIYHLNTDDVTDSVWNVFPVEMTGG